MKTIVIDLCESLDIGIGILKKETLENFEELLPEYILMATVTRGYIADNKHERELRVKALDYETALINKIGLLYDKSKDSYHKMIVDSITPFLEIEKEELKGDEVAGISSSAGR